MIQAELSALPTPVLAWHPAPGEWCAKEVLGHLIETEKRGFAGRIRIILKSDSPQLEGWDQEAVARARKSIANFKLRRGQPIATHVTLRGDRMYDFVDKLFSAALPRIKDFKGISERQFDGRGNLNIGMREQLIFPEIDYDKVEKIRGMDITLVTTAKSDEEGRELLKLLGLPLREAAPGEAGAPVAAAR